jgi:hypothetical protein
MYLDVLETEKAILSLREQEERFSTQITQADF